MKICFQTVSENLFDIHPEQNSEILGIHAKICLSPNKLCPKFSGICPLMASSGMPVSAASWRITNCFVSFEPMKLKMPGKDRNYDVINEFSAFGYATSSLLQLSITISMSGP